jgi:hypothetical protein
MKRSEVSEAFRRIRNSQREMDSVVRRLRVATSGSGWESELSGPAPEPEPLQPPTLGPTPKRTNPLWSWWKRSR